MISKSLKLILYEKMWRFGLYSLGAQLELKEQNWNSLVAVGNAIQYLITGVDSICWNWGGSVQRSTYFADKLCNSTSQFDKLIFFSPQLQSVFMWCGVIVLLSALQFLPMACRKSENSFVWHWKPWPVSRYNSSCPISQPMPQPIKLPASLPDYKLGQTCQTLFQPSLLKPFPLVPELSHLLPKILPQEHCYSF